MAIFISVDYTHPLSRWEFFCRFHKAYYPFSYNSKAFTSQNTVFFKRKYKLYPIYMRYSFLIIRPEKRKCINIGGDKAH